MIHDPLCPWRQAEESDGPERWLAGTAVCECDLITKVREDEQVAAGDRVAALLSGEFYGTAGFLTYFALYRKYVIAAASDDREALRDLEEKP